MLNIWHLSYMYASSTCTMLLREDAFKFSKLFVSVCSTTRNVCDVISKENCNNSNKNLLCPMSIYYCKMFPIAIAANFILFCKTSVS